MLLWAVNMLAAGKDGFSGWRGNGGSSSWPGKGGRNQEIALSAARGIAGLSNVAVFSFGSDGTDGPTDAAGGYADGSTAARLLEAGLSIPDVLERNDAYHALENRMAFLLQAQQGPMSTICPCFLLADDDVKKHPLQFSAKRVLFLLK